jgi:hypothetical protein
MQGDSSIIWILGRLEMQGDSIIYILGRLEMQGDSII